MRLSGALLVFWGCLVRADELTDEARVMLQDGGGWEYTALSDAQNGFPTVHTCFDGQPHENECSGKLTLTPGLRFTQVTRIKGQSVRRTGRYELNGDQLAFYDEFGTEDGPYTIQIDTDAKTLKMTMPQVTVELLLEKEYRDRLRKSAKDGDARAEAGKGNRRSWRGALDTAAVLRGSWNRGQ